MPPNFNPYQATKTAIIEIKPALEEIELASIPDRILARVVDSLLITAVAIAIVLLIAFVLYYSGDIDADFLEFLTSEIEEDSSLFRLNLTDPWIWIGVATTHTIFLALHGALLYRYGQTIGKRIMKIAIVDADTHEVVPLPRLFVFRYLIWDFPVLFFDVMHWIIRIADLCFGLRKNRRTLHDLTANTIVIKVAD